MSLFLPKRFATLLGTLTGDAGLMRIAQAGIALAALWFAIPLILVFSVKPQCFSAGGSEGWGNGLRDLLHTHRPREAVPHVPPLQAHPANPVLS